MLNKTNSIIRLSLFSVGFVLSCLNLAHAGSLEMTTYYPSPTGKYENLTALNLGVGTLTVQSNLNVRSLGVGTWTANPSMLSVGLTGLTRIVSYDGDNANNEGIFVVRQKGSGYAPVNRMAAITAGTDNTNTAAVNNALFEGRVYQNQWPALTPSVAVFKVYADGQGFFTGNLGVGTFKPVHLLDVDSTSAAGGEVALHLLNRSAAASSKTRLIQETGIIGSNVESTITNDAGATYGQYQVLAGNAIFTGNYYMPMHIFYTKNAFSADPWVERMKIDQAGNVGIGVTTPLSQLQIGDGINFNSDWPTMSYNSHWDGANWVYNAALPASMIYLDNTTGTLAFNTAPAGTAGAAITFNSGLSQESDGNVGIGEADPLRKLHVNGEIIGTDRMTLLNPSLGALDSTTSWSIDNYNTGSGSEFRIFSQPDINTAGTQRLWIRSATGEVVVGNVLTTLGSTADQALTITHNQIYKSVITGDKNIYLQWSSPHDSNVVIGQYDPSLYDATTNRHDLFVAGGIRARADIRTDTNLYANGHFYASDQRLKKDIQPLTGALDKILALKGVSFRWKKNPNETKIGLIAQDVEKVLPQIVHTEDNGYKSVEYGNIVAVLIEAMKEQEDRIKALEKEIDDLKNRQ